MTIKKNQKKLTLISFKVELIEGAHKLNELIFATSDWFELDNISSVYKKYLTVKENDLNSELWVVAKMKTHLDFEEAQIKLFEVQSNFLNGKINSSKTSKYEIQLLTHGESVYMSPLITLPHPNLHEDKMILKCAAEAWGNFEHPILSQTLNNLSQKINFLSNVEFHSQATLLKRLNK
jgi:7,8-dihydro-6-hydroxymethylpterin-pyrophosphokinase